MKVYLVFKQYSGWQYIESIPTLDKVFASKADASNYAKRKNLWAKAYTYSVVSKSVVEDEACK